MNEVLAPTAVRDINAPTSPSTHSAEPLASLKTSVATDFVRARSKAWRMRSATMIGASLALVAVIAAGLGWAAKAKVAITATAQGKIAPFSRIQVVAHAEGGAVRAVNVHVGQSVKAGDVLIELDATTAQADLKRFDNELLAHEAAIRRLEAEQLDRTPNFTGLPHELARSETNLFTARHAHYLAGVAAATGELASAKAGIAGAEAVLRPLRERLEGRRKLAATGTSSRFSVIEDEVKIGEVIGRLAASQASEKTATANIKERYYRRVEEIAKSLVERRNQQAELMKARPKILSRLENLSIVAPLDGVVKSVSVTGPGAVLKAGDALAEIVPGSGERLVVARLPAADIGYVHAGQSAQLSLIPPDMHFRPISGVVRMLAPDSVADERTGQLGYMVQIEPASTGFTAREGKATYPLLDGVPVAVTIVTGERTVLGLLVGPLFAGLEEVLGVK